MGALRYWSFKFFVVVYEIHKHRERERKRAFSQTLCSDLSTAVLGKGVGSGLTLNSLTNFQDPRMNTIFIIRLCWCTWSFNFIFKNIDINEVILWPGIYMIQRFVSFINKQTAKSTIDKLICSGYCNYWKSFMHNNSISKLLIAF